MTNRPDRSGKRSRRRDGRRNGAERSSHSAGNPRRTVCRQQVTRRRRGAAVLEADEVATSRQRNRRSKRDVLERRQNDPGQMRILACGVQCRDVAAFVLDVVRTDNPNVSRALLEFVILTAARSGEARQMEWSEVSLSTATWTVPAARMKARVAHRVPLSARVIEILHGQRRKHPEAKLVFSAPRGGVLSDMVLTKFLRDQNASSSDASRTATAHGFRSSFRDWASEHGYARDLAERALAHTIKDQSEAAYHRTDLLEQRRPMMEAWAQHVAGTARTSVVVPIRSG